MLRDSLQRGLPARSLVKLPWSCAVGTIINPEYRLREPDLQARASDDGKGDSVFSPDDRIGQLTMRNLISLIPERNFLVMPKLACSPPCHFRRAAGGESGKQRPVIRLNPALQGWGYLAYPL